MTTRVGDGNAPWALPDLFAAATVNVLALVGVAGCWVGAAIEVSWNPGLYWLQGAIVAAIIASIANAAWLLTGMRQLRERRRNLVQCWPALVERLARGHIVLSSEVVVTARRMTTYHVRPCLLMQGKVVLEGSREHFERQAHTACEMCVP